MLKKQKTLHSLVQVPAVELRILDDHGIAGIADHEGDMGLWDRSGRRLHWSSRLSHVRVRSVACTLCTAGLLRPTCQVLISNSKQCNLAACSSEHICSLICLDRSAVRTMVALSFTFSICQPSGQTTCIGRAAVVGSWQLSQSALRTAHTTDGGPGQAAPHQQRSRMRS